VTQHIEILKSVFADWNSGSRAVPASTHPDAVLHSTLTGADYTGHDGIRRWMAEIDEQFDFWELIPDEYRETSEDVVLVLGAVRMRGRASGVELEQPLAWVFRFEDELVVETWFFPDHDDGIAAAAGIG
jgi:ketosteroid isomerase-like protein